MTGAGDQQTGEGVDLTADEATALAKRIMADHLHDAEWLLWENFPELGEFAFERLSEAVDAEVQSAFEASRHWDRAMNIDSVWLKERAQ